MQSFAAVRRRKIATYIIIAGLLLWLGYEKIRFGIQELQIKFAVEQIEVFSQVVANAASVKDVASVTEALRYIESYYPSGTKQSKDSGLDRIVENVRQNACAKLREQIARLSAGADL
jgi:hypothetical protein